MTNNNRIQPMNVVGMSKLIIALAIPLCLFSYLLAMAHKPTMPNNTEKTAAAKTDKPTDDLRARLTPEQYYVTQEKGTERAFTGKYWNTKGDGKYYCIVCGAELFTSDSKFDSGCGWPSFDKAATDKVIDTHVDKTHGMVRDEIVCHKCGAHLGHVFNDGPTATGLRYCVNSASLDFKAKDAKPTDAKADNSKPDAPKAEVAKPADNKKEDAKK